MSKETLVFHEILNMALEAKPLHGVEAKALADLIVRMEKDLLSIGSSLSDYYYTQHPTKEQREKAEKNLQIWSQYT